MEALYSNTPTLPDSAAHPASARISTMKPGQGRSKRSILFALALLSTIVATLLSYEFNPAIISMIGSVPAKDQKPFLQVLSAFIATPIVHRMHLPTSTPISKSKSKSKQPRTSRAVTPSASAGTTQPGHTPVSTPHQTSNPTPTPTPTPKPTPSPTFQPLPGSWTRCAAENGTCAFSGTMTVAFGANGNFNYATLSNGTACTDTVFGDPDILIVKACYMEAVASTTDVWSQCAAENGTCAFSGTMTVAFGANGKFNYATLSNGTACTDTVFGDPDILIVKACYIVAPPATVVTWTRCSVEDQTCVFSGTHEVAFGANGQFFYKSMSNGTSCSDSVFGDPIYDTAKACYYQ